MVRAVGLSKITYSPAFDLKCGLSFMGIGTAASTHPCMSCNLSKANFANPKYMYIGGEKRTLQDIQDLAASYMHAKEGHRGAKKLSSAPFYNCEHPPLFESDLEGVLCRFVVELIPPMELHILLGLGNDCFNKKLKPCMDGLGWSVTLQRWLKAVDAKQSKHHGGQFNGIILKRLLQGVNHLRNFLDRGLNKSEKLQDVLQCMEAIDRVRDECFG